MIFENKDIQMLFENFEKKSLKLKYKRFSPIYQLFFRCFENWRYLLDDKNKHELITNLENYIKALSLAKYDAGTYGSKVIKNDYLLTMKKLHFALKNWRIE